MSVPVQLDTTKAAILLANNPVAHGRLYSISLYTNTPHRNNSINNNTRKSTTSLLIVLKALTITQKALMYAPCEIWQNVDPLDSSPTKQRLQLWQKYGFKWSSVCVFVSVCLCVHVLKHGPPAASHKTSHCNVTTEFKTNTIEEKKPGKCTLLE